MGWIPPPPPVRRSTALLQTQQEWLPSFLNNFEGCEKWFEVRTEYDGGIKGAVLLIMKDLLYLCRMSGDVLRWLKFSDAIEVDLEHKELESKLSITTSNDMFQSTLNLSFPTRNSQDVTNIARRISRGDQLSRFSTRVENTFKEPSPVPVKKQPIVVYSTPTFRRSSVSSYSSSSSVKSGRTSPQRGRTGRRSSSFSSSSEDYEPNKSKSKRKSQSRSITPPQASQSINHQTKDGSLPRNRRSDSRTLSVTPSTSTRGNKHNKTSLSSKKLKQDDDRQKTPKRSNELEKSLKEQKAKKSSRTERHQKHPKQEAKPQSSISKERRNRTTSISSDSSVLRSQRQGKHTPNSERHRNPSFKNTKHSSKVKTKQRRRRRSRSTSSEDDFQISQTDRRTPESSQRPPQLDEDTRITPRATTREGRRASSNSDVRRSRRKSKQRRQLGEDTKITPKRTTTNENSGRHSRVTSSDSSVQRSRRRGRHTPSSSKQRRTPVSSGTKRLSKTTKQRRKNHYESTPSDSVGSTQKQIGSKARRNTSQSPSQYPPKKQMPPDLDVFNRKDESNKTSNKKNRKPHLNEVEIKKSHKNKNKSPKHQQSSSDDYEQRRPRRGEHKSKRQSHTPEHLSDIRKSVKNNGRTHSRKHYGDSFEQQQSQQTKTKPSEGKRVPQPPPFSKDESHSEYNTPSGKDLKKKRQSKATPWKGKPEPSNTKSSRKQTPFKRKPSLSDSESSHPTDNIQSNDETVTTLPTRTPTKLEKKPGLLSRIFGFGKKKTKKENKHQNVNELYQQDDVHSEDSKKYSQRRENESTTSSDSDERNDNSHREHRRSGTEFSETSETTVDHHRRDSQTTSASSTQPFEEQQHPKERENRKQRMGPTPSKNRKAKQHSTSDSQRESTSTTITPDSPLEDKLMKPHKSSRSKQRAASPSRRLKRFHKTPEKHEVSTPSFEEEHPERSRSSNRKEKKSPKSRKKNPHAADVADQYFDRQNFQWDSTEMSTPELPVKKSSKRSHERNRRNQQQHMNSLTDMTKRRRRRSEMKSPTGFHEQNLSSSRELYSEHQHRNRNRKNVNQSQRTANSASWNEPTPDKRHRKENKASLTPGRDEAEVTSDYSTSPSSSEGEFYFTSTATEGDMKQKRQQSSSRDADTSSRQSSSGDIDNGQLRLWEMSLKKKKFLNVDSRQSQDRSPSPRRPHQETDNSKRRVAEGSPLSFFDKKTPLASSTTSAFSTESIQIADPFQSKELKPSNDPLLGQGSRTIPVSDMFNTLSDKKQTSNPTDNKEKGLLEINPNLSTTTGQGRVRKPRIPSTISKEEDPSLMFVPFNEKDLRKESSFATDCSSKKFDFISGQKMSSSSSSEADVVNAPLYRPVIKQPSTKRDLQMETSRTLLSTHLVSPPRITSVNNECRNYLSTSAAGSNLTQKGDCSPERPTQLQFGAISSKPSIQRGDCSPERPSHLSSNVVAKDLMSGINHSPRIVMPHFNGEFNDDSLLPRERLLPEDTTSLRDQLNDNSHPVLSFMPLEGVVAARSESSQESDWNFKSKRNLIDRYINDTNSISDLSKHFFPETAPVEKIPINGSSAVKQTRTSTSRISTAKSTRSENHKLASSHQQTIEAVFDISKHFTSEGVGSRFMADDLSSVGSKQQERKRPTKETTFDVSKYLATSKTAGNRFMSDDASCCDSRQPSSSQQDSQLTGEKAFDLSKHLATSETAGSKFMGESVSRRSSSHQKQPSNEMTFDVSKHLTTSKTVGSRFMSEDVTCGSSQQPLSSQQKQPAEETVFDFSKEVITSRGKFMAEEVATHKHQPSEPSQRSRAIHDGSKVGSWKSRPDDQFITTIGITGNDQLVKSSTDHQTINNNNRMNLMGSSRNNPTNWSGAAFSGKEPQFMIESPASDHLKKSDGRPKSRFMSSFNRDVRESSFPPTIVEKVSSVSDVPWLQERSGSREDVSQSPSSKSSSQRSVGSSFGILGVPTAANHPWRSVSHSGSF